jgi:hypothetical protein
MNKVRNHPLMRASCFPTWPPKWTTTHREKDDKPVGEVGILEDVVTSNLINNKIFMFMQCEGLRYMGFLSFDDVSFCSQIYTLLKANIGRSIKEIGDLDLSYTR